MLFSLGLQEILVLAVVFAILAAGSIGTLYLALSINRRARARRAGGPV